jgi:hypothetical protein
MPDDTSPDAGGGSKKEPKDEKKREQILVGTAVIGVILTVILIRRSSSNTTTASSQLPVGTTAIDPNTGLPYATELQQLSAGIVGTPAAAGSYSGAGLQPADLQALDTSLAGLTAALANFQPSSGGSSSPTSISVTSSPPVTTPAPPSSGVGGPPAGWSVPGGGTVNVYPGSGWTGSAADWYGTLGQAAPGSSIGGVGTPNVGQGSWTPMVNGVASQKVPVPAK